jgi:hypothetical protein
MASSSGWLLAAKKGDAPPALPPEAVLNGSFGKAI